MGKWIEKSKEYWKDPVWSKVISAGIIFVAGALLTSIYAALRSIYLKVSFVDTVKVFSGALSAEVKIPFWCLILIGVLFLIFTTNQIYVFFRKVLDKIRKPKMPKPKIEQPFAAEHSTVLFSYRMAKSFPGLRGLAWFNEPFEAVKRLEILLKEPLAFKNGSIQCESDPIWWFRGISSSHISAFEKLGRKKALMNFDQLKIKRIAAFQSNSYYKDFVYVEVYGEKPTGLYNITEEEKKKHIEFFGYSWEEFGLIKRLFFGDKIIRREQYDDGATVIRGNVVNAENAKLRTVYTSDYNFIITAKGAPYNSTKFERESKKYLDGILQGQVLFDDFFEFMQGFKKNEN